MALSKNQLRFLAAWNKHPTIRGAAKRSKTDRGNVHDWIRDCPEFAEAFKAAQAALVDMLEAEAFRRAHDGTLKPVFQGGKQVGTIREYSDALLGKLLCANAPHKYQDRLKHEFPAAGIPVRVVELPPEESNPT